MSLSETLAVCHLVTPDEHSQDLRSCVGVGVTWTLQHRYPGRALHGVCGHWGSGQVTGLFVAKLDTAF